ncbi:MAG: CxxC-x17-CxxC domain-containing protein [Planctomycetota bacterium]
MCDACGQRFRLPFEPKPGRPIYCPDCFRYR